MKLQKLNKKYIPHKKDLLFLEDIIHYTFEKIELEILRENPAIIENSPAGIIESVIASLAMTLIQNALEDPTPKKRIMAVTDIMQAATQYMLNTLKENNEKNS